MMLFISGLTGVGKSSTLKALGELKDYILLPNRRELTDQIIIPEVLQDEGKNVYEVKDRLERFRLTAAYRQKHPKGIIKALQSHMQNLPIGNYIFDNIRGLEECQAAIQSFPEARVIFLDAPPLVRLKRLLGRKDSFDQVLGNLEAADLLEQLHAIENIHQVFEPQHILNLKTSNITDRQLLDAVHIILAEHKNYNAAEAACFLRQVLPEKQLLYLETSQLGIEQVRQNIEKWL